MKRIINTVAILMLFSLFVPRIYAAEPKLAPDFSLLNIYQDEYILSTYRDKQPVLLFFWTTWCPFCAKELRLLNQSYAGMVDDGVEVLAVNVGELPDTVENFVNSYLLSYPVLTDKDTRVALSYGIVGVPAYVLIDRKGYIVFQENYLPKKEYKDLILKDSLEKNKPSGP